MKTINIQCYRSDGVYIVPVEVPDDATKEEIHEAIEALDNKIKEMDNKEVLNGREGKKERTN